MSEYEFVGVDVSKDKFDVFVQSTQRHKCFTNSPAGFKAFLDWLDKMSCLSAWVCMEATGNYSLALAEFIHAHNIKVSVVNPKQIKAFSQAKLMRNKTDKLDAKVIAQFCEAITPRVFSPKKPQQKQLAEYAALYYQLKKSIVQLKNGCHSATLKTTEKAFEKAIKPLEQQAEKLMKTMYDLVQQEPETAKLYHSIIEIKGIGAKSAILFLANLPDLSLFETPKQLIAYAGLNPRRRESGKYKGKTKLSKLGDPRLRNALHMAALSVKRSNEHFQTFVRRLEANGKTQMDIVIAITRKLFHIIFGMFKNNEPFIPEKISGNIG